MSLQVGRHDLSQHLGLNIHDRVDYDYETYDVDGFSVTSDDHCSREETSSECSDNGTILEIEFGDDNDDLDEDEYIEFLLEMGPNDTIRIGDHECCVIESDDDDPLDDEDETDEEDLEYALEEKEYIICSGDGKIVFKIETSLSQDEDHVELEWLETVNARCTLDGRDIGRALGRFIDREAIRKTFWENMDLGSDCTAELAFDIFDRWGYLKSLYKDHPVQRGIRVWDDLDHGMLFLIEDAYIDNDFRRKGLGRVMVEALLEKAQKHATYSGQGPDEFMEELYGSEVSHKLASLHALVMPRATDRDAEWQSEEEENLSEQQEVDKQVMKSITSFWRSVGFRRVGASKCLAFSYDPEHPSHKIPASEDFDLVPYLAANDDTTKDVSESDGEETQGSEKDISPREKIPIHSAVVALDDAECVKFFEHFKQNHNPNDLVQRDSFGNNPLHVAACQVKPLSLKWILDNVTGSQQWKQDRNNGGFTPFEALRELLEVARTRMMDGSTVLNVSDQFEGYSNDAVACLSLVEDDASKIGVIPALHSLQLRYGCTCGKCLGGFISPRMGLALCHQAHIMSARLTLSIKGGVEWCILHKKTLSYLSPDVQETLKYDTILRWLIKRIFLQVAVCLRADVVPRGTTVLAGVCNGQRWPASRQRDVADNIESVLTAIFAGARAKDVKAGDGSVEGTIGVELEKLEICRNDHEFSFVARACGVCQDVS